MKNAKGKTTAVSLFLMFAMAVSLVALPTANAQGASSKKTYAFIGATPNPVGVDQEVLLHVGIPDELGNAAEGWEGLTVTVTRPDGTTETLGPIRTDATGGTGYVYVPTMVGNYTLQTHFPEQVCEEGVFSFFTGYMILPNTTMLASDSEEITLVVQEEPIEYYPGVPLPTEYWTRPINAQFHEWAPIAGNWLRPAGSYTMPPIPKYHSGNENAPETAHILWTTQLAQGGLTGGELGNVQYEMGDAYEGKFLGSVIIDGVLYYNRFQEQGGSNVDQEVVAINLKTGEELWVKNWNNTRLAFGQVFFWDSYNYHGAFAYLWTTVGTTWHAYDALTGRWVYSITDVPSGWNLYGPKGEIYRYTVDLANGWMTLWNSSRAVNPQNTGWFSDGSWQPIGNTYDGARGIEWNVSIPTGLPGGVDMYFLEDRIIGTTATLMGTTAETVTSWAINVKPGQEGELIFKETWTRPAGNLTVVYTDASAEDGVFILSAKENLKYYGFSLDTGKLLWETEPEMYLALYDKWYGPAYGYGRFFTGRQSGIVNCYNITTGEKLWTYEVKDKYAEILWSNNWPIEFHFLADGKIYLSYGEHSPINPTGRGAPFVCLDVETGEEIWTLSWFNNWWGGHAIIGDSVIAGMNAYDNRIYAIGKGPSATAVSASPKVSVHGDSILVEGMVTDISPGTEEYALTARFPNGVPAVSDENMTEWMEYVYMQYERPADVVGVEVVVEVLDPNNNYYEVGRTTSDENGLFKLMFTPEVPGEYTLIASFAGSGAYYGSFAETAFGVEEAPQPTPEPTPTPAPMTDTYVMGFGIGMIIAIVVVGLLLFLLLRKR